MEPTVPSLIAMAMEAALGFVTHRAGLCTVKAVAEVLTSLQMSCLWFPAKPWQEVGSFELGGPLLLGLGGPLAVEFARVGLQDVRRGNVLRSTRPGLYPFGGGRRDRNRQCGHPAAERALVVHRYPAVCLGGAVSRLRPARGRRRDLAWTPCWQGASSVQRRSIHLRTLRLRALRHGAGGLMMGVAMAMISGGNDGLILFAIPSLSPHTLPACAAIALGIVLALVGTRALGQGMPFVVCASDICRAAPRRPTLEASQ